MSHTPASAATTVVPDALVGGATVMTPLAASGALAGLLDALASATPTPGAGPAVAWTCAVAAALVEMVATIATRDGRAGASHAAALARCERAHQLRERALQLADVDAAAYQAALATRHQRGSSPALRGALSAAADPPLAISETAAEVCRLAADGAEHARGGVRGEAAAAAILAEAATAACVPMLRLNLAGDPSDPRLTRGIQLANDARLSRARATRRRGAEELSAPADTSS